MKPQKPQLGKSVQMLIHGPPGIGKTVLIAQQPKTLILHPPTDHLDSIKEPDNVDEIILNDHDDFEMAYQFLQQGGSDAYDWVWLDSLSLFQDHGLDEIWKNLIAAKPDRAKWGLDKGEYGRNMERIARKVREMVGLSKSGAFHFGITCHSVEMEDPETEKDLLMPYVQGKMMSTRVMAAMNMVGYYRWAKVAKRRVRVLDFHETDSFKAKDQLEVFGEKGRLISPTMPDIHRAISKKKKPSKPATRRKRARRKR